MIDGALDRFAEGDDVSQRTRCEAVAINVQVRLHGTGTSRDHAERLLALAQSPGVAPGIRRVAMRSANVVFSGLGDLDRSAVLLQELATDPEDVAARVNLGLLYRLQGRLELAVAELEDAWAMAVARDDASQQVHAGAQLGNLLECAGRPADAREIYAKVDELATTLGHVVSRAAARLGLASVARGTDQIAAERMYRAVRRDAQKFGLLHAEAIATVSLGELRHLQGDAAGAVSLYGVARASFERMGWATMIALARAYEALATAESQSLEEGLGLLCLAAPCCATSREVCHVVQVCLEGDDAAWEAVANSESLELSGREARQLGARVRRALATEG